MPRITFSIGSSVPAERVLAAGRDFSERRPELWPNIAPELYQVHEVTDTYAEVTEGSNFMGKIWARERYEWPEPDLVKAIVQDSNIVQPGGVWEMRVTPRDGGSHIEIVNHRRGKGVRGRFMLALVGVIGRFMLPQDFKKTLMILEERRGDDAVPGA